MSTTQTPPAEPQAQPGCLERSVRASRAWKQGPIIPVEVARDLWLALHHTRNSNGSTDTPLSEDEEKLYRHLTMRFVFESAILSVECLEEI